MVEQSHAYDVVVDFWQWYRRRQERHQERRYNPLESYALDRCEEAFQRSQWDRFGYWHAIYLRERRRSTPARHDVV